LQTLPVRERDKLQASKTLGTNEGENQVGKEEQRHCAPEDEIEQHFEASQSLSQMAT